MVGPKRSTKLAILALGLLFLLLALAKVVGWVNSLNQPFSHGLKNTGTLSWDTKTAVNIIFAHLTSPNESLIHVVHLSGKEEQITILDISGQVYTSVPKGFGNWKVGSIYKLGQEETPPIGGELLKLAISRLLGLPIDGLVVIKDKNLTPEQLISSVHKNRLELLTILSKVESDLTPLELTQLFYQYSATRSDKINTLNFEKSSLTESKLLPDTSRVLGIDSVKLDLFVRQNLSDGTIADEGATVAIFNGTNIPGLATEVARTVENLGGTVITVTNSDKNYQKSLVTVNESSSAKTVPQTLRRLSEIFAPYCSANLCSSDDAKINDSRAKINVILGEDYYNKWYKR